MKQSEIFEAQLAELEKKEKAATDEFYVSHKATDADWDEAFRKFWVGTLRPIRGEIDVVKIKIATEKNREIAVGDGVTMHLWSDAHACTVIARTAKTLTIQRDKAIRDPNFKPEWIPGGFSAICTNCEDQSWTYERDENGEVTRCHWSEKHGRWQASSDGSIKISRGRREYYDYNF